MPSQVTITSTRPPIMKKSGETLKCSVDLTNLLDGSTLTTVDASSTTKTKSGDTSDGSAFALSSVSISGATIRFTIAGGYDGENWDVHLTANRSDGAIRGTTVPVEIRNQ